MAVLRSSRPFRRVPRVVALVVAASLMVGCATDAGDSSVSGPTVATVQLHAEEIDGPLADHFDLDGADLWVGSEDVPTQRLLGYVAVEALDAVGADVDDEIGAGGSLLVREMLMSGEIDLYWERVSAAWTNYLREEEVTDDVTELHEQLSSRDLEENGIVWLAPAAFVDGPGFAMAEDFAEALDLVTLEDMASYIDEGGPTSICVSADFMTFPDQGRMRFEDTLGIELDDDVYRVTEPEDLYGDIDDGTCLFGLVDRVSGQIPEHDLRVFDDDVGLYPPDNPAMTVREDVYAEHHELGPLFALLAEALDDEAMQAMNRRVEVDDVEPRRVAHDWLLDEGFIEE